MLIMGCCWPSYAAAMHWQLALLQRLRDHAPAGSEVIPYGSVTQPSTLDRWSDLDVELTLGADVEAGTLFGGVPWAWQDSTDGDTQHVRLVLVDGRRVDITAHQRRLVLPEDPVDNDIRFDAALAAVRLGRGNDLIGLHLVLGILRSALVQVMLRVDETEHTTHHRSGSALDAEAATVGQLLTGPLEPALAVRATEFYARCRAGTDATYRPDWSGLGATLGIADSTTK